MNGIGIHMKFSLSLNQNFLYLNQFALLKLAENDVVAGEFFRRNLKGLTLEQFDE